MLDDAGLPTRLITLGVALVAFGLGCHYWADRVYRTSGLAIGAVQLCRYLIQGQIGRLRPAATSENRITWMKFCDYLTAVLLVMAFIHAIAAAST